MDRRREKTCAPREVIIPIKHRFTSKYYSEEECRLAINGEKIPQALGSKIAQRCVIRGIRQHQGFAEELHSSLPCFTRALNARQIMSNHVPNMEQAEDFPYCIWYPDCAEEDTYREIAIRYPRMKYIVGRACAVAGYTTLYRELNLLPEVHIVEEARDNGSTAIFKDIMANRNTFDVMNDFTRSVDHDESTPRHSNLNGETAVRSSLDLRRQFSQDLEISSDNRESNAFDITEDFGVDTTSHTPSAVTTARNLAIDYLYTPLPMDLPPLQKDLLILVAAYNGDIDRYARLRYRGRMLRSETTCLAHGIHHNAFFAKWFTIQIHNQHLPAEAAIQRAIAARAIMDNDLSRISPTTLAPQLIWYPQVPERGTLELLLILRPNMAQQIARACIVGDYQDLYDKIDPMAHFGLIAEAKASDNRHFLQDQEAKAAKAAADGIAWQFEPKYGETWQLYTKNNVFNAKLGLLEAKISTYSIGSAYSEPLPECVDADASEWELIVSVAPEAQTSSPAPRTAFWNRIEKVVAQEGQARLAFEYSEEAKRILDREN